MTVKESCPYCGEMTDMVYDPKATRWKSGSCSHCKKSLVLDLPELVDEKPDLKAPGGVLPE